MNNIKMIVLVLGGSVLLVVLMAVGLSKMSSNTGITNVSVDQLISGARWDKTTGEAKVTVVEFSDMQCPACRVTEPIAVELRKMNGVRFVYRHFPLITIHKNAWKAARAIEAARLLSLDAQDKDKGWEMMRLVFEKQDEWSDLDKPEELFVRYAKVLGMDEIKFNDSQKSEETDKYVKEDSDLGNKIKLSGTPTFFVNGEQIGSSYVLDKVKSLLK